MNEVAMIGSTSAVAVQVASLPALVQRAATALASATTAAEVLDAKSVASFAYDAAKAAARFARAKGAFDEVITSVYRSQADALEIEAMAKRRLADEYDAAQERGELRGRGDNPRRGDHLRPADGMKLLEVDKKLRASDLGMEHYEIHEARKVRDAEKASPGIVRSSLDDILDRGDEPSKAAVSREINTRLNSFSGDNEWYTPAKYIEMARSVMGGIDVDPASNDYAQMTVNAKVFYTEENDGLDKDWTGRLWMNPPYSNPEIQNFVERLISQFESGQTTEAIVLTNNSGDTAWHQSMQYACKCMCITRGRIRFESRTRESNSPAMGQSFFYFGRNAGRFAEVFGEIGKVWSNM